MWVNDDVDVPEALLDAQRDGRLVTFAGAGVSMGPPSNLPGFDALATQIAAGLLEPAANESFDVFLGRVNATPSNLEHFTLYRLHESHLAASNSATMGRYLRALLSRAQSLAHSCDEAFDMASEALDHGASKDDVLAVAEHMARFGCEKAGQLRDKANAL